MSASLIGRHREVARLGRALDDASGASGVVLLAGEAGGGKTRLVGALGDVARQRGFRVCVGRCVELGEEIWPLAPLREIVTDLVDDLDEASIDDVIGSAGARAVLGRLVPELNPTHVEGP